MAVAKIKESDIQDQCIKYLELLSKKHSLYYFRSNTGSFNIVDKKGNNRYMKTGKKGCPDIILLIEGMYLGIEVKTSIGIQSEAQKQASDEIAKAGGYYLLVRSLQEMIDDIEEIVSLTKE